MTIAPDGPFVSAVTPETLALLGGRPSEESLMRATTRLEQVIDAAPSMEPWIAELRDAIQGCALAVEYHFVGLGARGGTRDQIERDQPRLISQIESLDTELSRTLVDAWKAKDAVVGCHRDIFRPVAELAVSLRALIGREFDLQHEVQVATGGED
jgi:hypothetical protein